MPTILKTKNSVTTTVVPTTLQQGELAVNITDKKLWVGNAATTPVQLFGAGADGSFANLAYTGTLTGGTGIVNLGSGQFYKDASGNIGLGTASPVYSLNVFNSNQPIISLPNSTTGTTNCFLLRSFSTDGYIDNASTGSIIFRRSSSFTESMRIDSSGNVAIGTSSASSRLTIDGGTTEIRSGNALLIRPSGNANDNRLVALSTAGLDVVWGGAPSTSIMHWANGGNVGIGTSSPAAKLDVVGGAASVTASGAAVNILNLKDSVDQSGATFIQFLNSTGGNIGNVNRVTTTNAVVYNTTSDYRLKTVIGDVTGQGSRIDALKPIDYQWKEGNEQARGFLAHEFQTVYPNSVSGEKDAIDKDGNPKYQSMQASSSEVMADLIAEIQSLRKRVAILESK